MVDFESMGALSFTFVDVLVVVVILISAIFAAGRGFVRESLSIVAWAAAAFAALFFGPALIHALRGVVSGWAAMLLAYGGIFLVVVIPLSFISFRFSENVRRSPVGPVDRALGVAFGVVRGLAIIAICYLLFSIIVPIPRQPDWMTQARFLPLIQSSSETVLALIPDQRLEAAHAPDRRLVRRREPEPVARPHRQERQAAEPAATKRPKKMYGAHDRQALDKLIEATADGGGRKR